MLLLWPGDDHSTTEPFFGRLSFQLRVVHLSSFAGSQYILGTCWFVAGRAEWFLTSSTVTRHLLIPFLCRDGSVSHAQGARHAFHLGFVDLSSHLCDLVFAFPIGEGLEVTNVFGGQGSLRTRFTDSLGRYHAACHE